MEQFLAGVRSKYPAALLLVVFGAGVEKSVEDNGPGSVFTLDHESWLCEKVADDSLLVVQMTVNEQWSGELLHRTKIMVCTLMWLEFHFEQFSRGLIRLQFVGELGPLQFD